MIHKADSIKFSELTALSYKRPQTEDPKKVAKDFEALFVSLVLKEMKKTVSFCQKSFAEDVYWDILYDRASQYLAQKGLGIGKILLKCLRPEKFKELPVDADKIVKGVACYESE
ncbi:MAG: hypothetical protein RMJ39_09435 [Deltaproteobacteria bacterium]|nr:hypothetical protein [Deltaproteobacteria bacterium]